MRLTKPVSLLLLFLASACTAKPPPPAPVPEAVPTDGPPAFSGKVGGDTTPSAALALGIVEPVGAATYYNDDAIRFVAALSDGAGRAMTPETITWVSDRETITPVTTTPFTARLSQLGRHKLVVTASARGLTVSAFVEVEIVDPSARLAVRFKNPPSNGLVVLNRPETFNLVRFELEVSGTPASSSLEYTFRTSTGEPLTATPAAFTYLGVLGTPTSPPPTGEYTLEVSVNEKNSNRTGRASVPLRVLPSNLPPTVTIVAPVDRAVVPLGGTVELTGTLEDLDATRKIVPDVGLIGEWHDSSVGKFATGLTASLPATATTVKGKHLVSFCATDRAGVTSCAKRTLYVSNAASESAALLDLAPAVPDSLLPQPWAASDRRMDFFFNDPAGNFWLVNQGAVSLTGPDGNAKTLTMNGGSVVIGGGADVFDLAFLGSHLFAATSSGVRRCDFTDGGAALTVDSTSCVQVDDIASGSLPDAYATNAPSRTLATAGVATLIAGSNAGLATVSDPTLAAGAIVDRFFQRDAAPPQLGFGPDADILQAELVDGELWLVTSLSTVGSMGLCVASPALPLGPSAQVTCGKAPSGLDALIDLDVTALLVTSETGATVVYVGTRHGMIRYDKAKNAGIRYTREQGLAGDTVGAMAVRGGAVWVATDGGASRVDFPTGLIANFDAADFSGANASQLTALGVDATGRLWLSLGNALVQGQNASVFHYLGQ